MEGSRSPLSLQPEQAYFQLRKFKILQCGLTTFTKQLGSLKPERHRDEDLYNEECSGKASWEDGVLVAALSCA